jgi:hypothetical protein
MPTNPWFRVFGENCITSAVAGGFMTNSHNPMECKTLVMTLPSPLLPDFEFVLPVLVLVLEVPPTGAVAVPVEVLLTVA